MEDGLASHHVQLELPTVPSGKPNLAFENAMKMASH